MFQENYEYCVELLQYLFKKVDYKKNDGVIVMVNCGLSQDEKMTYLNLLHDVGFKEVVLVLYSPRLLAQMRPTLAHKGKNHSFS